MSNLKHIFDTHSHYDDQRFESKGEEIIAKLFADGLSGIVHASIDYASAQFGLDMSKKFARYFTSIGIHPEYASNLEWDVSYIRTLAKSSDKVVAIGEIGLDYHYDGYDRSRQITLFREQIELANELSLPVIVHSRDATGDTIDILRELRPRGIMHCFSGSYETAKEVLNLGMYLGFTGVLTFKNSKKTQEVVSKIPLDRLLLETDCPYMAPEPHRGETSNSGMIIYTAQKAADLRGIIYDDLIIATERNAEQVFGISHM